MVGKINAKAHNKSVDLCDSICFRACASHVCALVCEPVNNVSLSLCFLCITMFIGYTWCPVSHCF